MGTFNNIKEGWINFIKANENYDLLPDNVKEMSERRAEICKVCPELKESGMLFQIVERLLPNGVGKQKMRKTFDPESGEKGDVYTGYKCGACGCAFPANVMAPGKACPKNKWPAENIQL
jgi:hypothetical protein